MTALMAWPRFDSLGQEPQGANQMAGPAVTRTPNLHRANQRSLLESADGSMATAANLAGEHKTFFDEAIKESTIVS